jgi:hypothetical protein
MMPRHCPRRKKLVTIATRFRFKAVEWWRMASRKQGGCSRVIPSPPYTVSVAGIISVAFADFTPS